VADLDPEPAVEMLGEKRLLLGTTVCPACLDEADAPPRTSQDLQVLEQLTGEQVADVLPGCEPEAGVCLRQDRTEPLLEDALGAGEHVQPADSREVGLEKLEAALPLRALEQHRGIQPPEDGIPPRVGRPPAAPDPALLDVRHRDGPPDVGVRQPQREHPLGRLVKRERGGVKVAELGREHGQRRGEDGHLGRATLVQVQEHGPPCILPMASSVSRIRSAGLASSAACSRARETPVGQPDLLCRRVHARPSPEQERCPGELRELAAIPGRKLCAHPEALSLGHAGWSKLQDEHASSSRRSSRPPPPGWLPAPW
jgi:hypothetical protein